MAQKVIRLNESELKEVIKNVILEMGNPSLSEFDAFGDDDPDLGGDVDFSQYDIPDINAATKGNEYHGEMDQNEFSQEDPDEIEAKMDADIVNDPNRDINPDDGEETMGEPETDEPDESPITPLSQRDEEPVEQHQEGDVIYYENTPIEFKNGQYHMTIEDGFDMGDSKCPKITVVGSNLKAVESEYDNLWDNYYYKDHIDYVKNMQDKGLAQYDFSGVGSMDASQINLEELPIIVNLG